MRSIWEDGNSVSTCILPYSEDSHKVEGHDLLVTIFTKLLIFSNISTGSW